jgi:hypothetical protein
MEKKKNDTNGLEAFDEILQGLEFLRSHITDLEAMAYAAENALEFVPSLFRILRGYDPATMQVEDMSETRRNLGRLHAFVVNTSQTSHSVLEEVEQLLDKAQQFPARSGKGKNGSSSAHERRPVYHVKRRLERQQGLRAVV